MKNKNIWIITIVAAGGILLGLLIGFYIWQTKTAAAPSPAALSAGAAPDSATNESNGARDSKFLNSAVVMNTSKHFIINFNPLREKFIGIQKEYPQKTYIYFNYLNNASWIGLNEKDMFFAASTVKVPLAMSIYKMAEQGKLTMSASYSLSQLDLDAAFGDLYKVGADKTFTIEDLMKFMLEQSDDTAMNALYDVLKLNGLSDPFSDVYDSMGWVYYADMGTTPSYMNINLETLSNMFIALYNATYINPDDSAKVLEHLDNSPFNNQIVAGVNYFHQVFDDNKPGSNVVGTGLITGTASSNAPKLQISGFDTTGVTPPLGRIDASGQIADNLSWVKGKHEAKFGGEYRHVQLDEFYHRNSQGNYKFNGKEAAKNGLTNGWDFSKSNLASGVTDSSVIARLNSLADFLAGYVHSGAVTIGDPERTVYINTFSAFAQDSYQLTKKLNINFGLRYDYVQPFHDSKKDLSVFRPDIVPSTGLAVQGDQVSSLYNPYYTSVSPRIGANYQLAQHTVIRAGAGLYYDTPNLNPFLDNRPGNSAPNGVESNPAGTNQVSALGRSSYVWQANVNSLLSSASTGIFSIQKGFHPSTNLNYNLQVEQSITPNVIAQLGYVGSQGRHLLSIIDINQSLPKATDVNGDYNQNSRPYYTKYSNYSNINDIESIGDSNYNSLQATLRASNLHRFTAQLAYTWSHSLDDVSAFRGALPQDSTNFKGDYGQNDYDSRHTFVGEVSYQVPGSERWKAATTGWQANSSFSFHSGFPFTVLTDSQTDNTGENNQRANQVGNPYAGFKKAAVGANWLNPAAFANPAGGHWGTSRRNAYTAPGYGDVDFSVFKNTKIGERVNAQFRVELYNLLNRTNYAPPLGGGSEGYNPNQATISTLQLYDTIGDFNGAPGIGAGEPFNTQFALKITF